MENLQVVLSLIVTIIGFLTSTVTFLVKYIKSASARSAAEDQVKLTDALMRLIEEAEQMTQMSGEEKKSYVLAKAQSFAAEHGLSCELTVLEQKLEELIDLTKNVNTKK